MKLINYHRAVRFEIYIYKKKDMYSCIRHGIRSLALQKYRYRVCRAFICVIISIIIDWIRTSGSSYWISFTFSLRFGTIKVFDSWFEWHQHLNSGVQILRESNGICFGLGTGVGCFWYVYVPSSPGGGNLMLQPAAMAHWFNDNCSPKCSFDILWV